MNELAITEQPTPIPAPEPIAEESEHRGNGKVARLPKVLRDQVNRMLDDGLSYKAIIEKLEQSTDPPLPYKLLEMNVSRWKDNGYQRYLRHQEWRDDLRILRESGSEMTELNDGPKFQETLTQIALTEIFRVLQQGELKPDSLNYIRLFNALARLNREALGLRKYNDLLAKEQAELKKLELGRKISTNEHRAIVDQADQIFRMPRPRPAETSPEPCRRRREEAQINDQSAISDSRIAEPGTGCTPPSPIENPSSPLPSRPCRAETSGHAQTRLADSSPSPGGEGQGEGGRTDPQREKRTRRPLTTVSPSIQNPKSKIKNPSPSTLDTPPSERCLDCRHPLPPLTPEGKRPNERCEQCNILLPPPGTCTRPSSDKCHFCGTTLPHRLPSGRRPKYVCHNCAAGLGRETDEDIKKYAEE